MFIKEYRVKTKPNGYLEVMPVTLDSKGRPMRLPIMGAVGLDPQQAIAVIRKKLGLD